MTDVSTSLLTDVSSSFFHLTLKIASAQVVETSVTNNSPSQDSNHPDDLFFNQGIKKNSQHFPNVYFQVAFPLPLQSLLLKLPNVRRVENQRGVNLVKRRRRKRWSLTLTKLRCQFCGQRT